MNRIRIRSDANTFFPSLWKIYEFSFPLCERRSLHDQKKIFTNNSYFLEAWIKNGTVIGFIGWWDCEDLRYVEHYAIDSAYRSEGYGSQFLSEWMNENDKLVLLEIEPVEDEITQRRQNFYKRLGFVESKIQHSHPPYHSGMDNVNLWLMTYPTVLSDPNIYERFRQKQQVEIMPPVP